MAALKNYVDGQAPLISAAWLNQVDIFVNSLFNAATDAGGARTAITAAKSGVNTDITSLNAPALGAATAITAAPGDNSTKVATTAYVAANTLMSGALQAQTATAFTTGGTSTAYTLTPNPVIAANTPNFRFRVKFNATNGAAPTLAVSGQAALPLMVYNSLGVLTAVATGSIVANQLSDVETDGTNWILYDPLPQNPFVWATSVPSTSGTTLDFTGLPSWVKKITIGVNGVSLSGASNILCQLGTSGGVVATGYLGGASQAGSSGSQAVVTTGMQLGLTGVAATTAYGIITILNMGGNVWVMNFLGSRLTDGFGLIGGASISLGAVLDRVRLTSANGTDTFDAGAVNITYEG